MTEKEIKSLTEVEQRSKSNTRQIEEIKKEIREINESMKEFQSENKAIYVIAESVRNLTENFADLKIDVKDIKKNQGETLFFGEDIKEIKRKQDELARKINDIENKPAHDVMNNLNKLKWAIITSVVLLIVGGIVGAIISFGVK